MNNPTSLKPHYFRLLGIVLLILAALFIPEFIYLQIHHKKLVHEAERAGPLPFKVMNIQAEQQEVAITLPTYLVGMNVAPIWARVNGYLVNFFADIGDKVEQGQLLAQLDTPDLDAELAQAESELASYEAKESIARITAERWQDLYAFNPEAISLEEVDRTTAAFQAAFADTAAAKANVSRLQALQSFKYIYAPFDGVITTRNIDIGQLVTLGSDNNPLGYPEEFNQKKSLFQIENYISLRAFADVPQAFYYLVKDGAPVEVRVPEYPGSVWTGVISRNAGALDPLARTLLTQVDIDNSYGKLLPGLYAELTFKFPPERMTYRIPIAALIIRSGPPMVALLKEDNTVYYQEVEIGHDWGKSIEITAGLEDHDLVIVNPTDRIQEGVRIEPQLISKQEVDELTL